MHSLPQQTAGRPLNTQCNPALRGLRPLNRLNRREGPENLTTTCLFFTGFEQVEIDSCYMYMHAYTWVEYIPVCTSITPFLSRLVNVRTLLLHIVCLSISKQTLYSVSLFSIAFVIPINFHRFTILVLHNRCLDVAIAKWLDGNHPKLMCQYIVYCYCRWQLGMSKVLVCILIMCTCTHWVCIYVYPITHLSLLSDFNQNIFHSKPVGRSYMCMQCLRIKNLCPENWSWFNIPYSESSFPRIVFFSPSYQ